LNKSILTSLKYYTKIYTSITIKMLDGQEFISISTDDWLKITKKMPIHENCPDCQSDHVIKKGFTVKRTQRIQCADCQTYWTIPA
jgi:transposase-like protein